MSPLKEFVAARFLLSDDPPLNSKSVRMKFQGSGAAESFCGWCGKCGDLVKCESCAMFFCPICIKRTLGEECMSESKFSVWQCFCCSPSQLKQFVMDCDKALNGFAATGSDVSSESSDSDIDHPIR